MLGPLKWPHEFFFIDVVEGLEKYDAQMKAHKASQKEVFQHIFGIPCVRETLRQKRLFLQEIERNQEDLYENFLSMGRVHEARWAYFESCAANTRIRFKERLELLSKEMAPEARCVCMSFFIPD